MRKRIVIPYFSGLAPQQDPSYDMSEYHTDVLTVHTHCMGPYQLLPPSYWYLTTPKIGC